MSEQAGTYKITIQTTAQGDGAKKTADELGHVSASAKDAGEKLSIGLKPDAFNKLGDAALDNKGKVEKHSEALQEGGEHAKLFGEKTRDAKEAVRALGESMPGVGHLARDMSTASGLAIGLLGMALETLVEHFQRVREEEEAFVASAAKGVGSLLREQAGTAAEAAEEHQKLADALANAATGEDSLLTSMGNRIALFENYIAGLKKVEKAEDEAEEARIKRAQREGKITPEQASASLDAIHSRAQDRDAAHDDQAKQFRLDQE
jgi:polyhydroxyalkanoate synthesis regulator phasin